MIKFSDVSKAYSQGQRKINVLENVSFQLADEGSIALVGKSGSGKSTFLSLLAGLDSVDTGEIEIDGEKISALSEEKLTEFRSENIGIIFQDFNLIENFTALENVLLPLEVLKISEPVVKAMKMLELVGLANRASHFPKQLSGGERQRVAMARACVTNPKYILADEPSGNLDPDTGEAVMKILFDTAKELKQTFLLITHDHDLANQCDHIYEIENHHIIKRK